LQRHIEQEIEADSTLSTRLESLELPPDAIELENLDRSPPNKHHGPEDPESGTATPIRTRAVVNAQHGEDTNTRESSSHQETFEVVLSTTRVYDRVRNREVDDMNSVRTTRSHAWSILSGRSMAEISVIAVIKLPLYEAELERFRQFALVTRDSSSPATGQSLTEYHSPSSNSSQPQSLPESFFEEYGLNYGYHGNPSLMKIKKELRDIACDPVSSISFGPTGDDLASTSIP
jgi:hypothetical protein